MTALLEAHKRLAQQNHFEVLGIGHDATPQDIKKAYFNLAKRYHPDRHFGPPLNEMKSELEALFHAIHEAHETLASPERREKYNRELAAGSRQQRVKKEARSDKQVNSAAAAAHFKEGMKYFTERNFWDAEESFQWALRFDPSQAEYVFRRAMALSHIPRRGRDAEEYFAKTITMDPLKMDYYLEFANFYVRLGLKAKAMALYQNALKQDPAAEKIKEAIRKAGE
jgi:curved DNA-binding protein CbpA